MANANSRAENGDETDTIEHDPDPVASGLADVLADTYRLMFKTHAKHWNVEGTRVFAIHSMTETHYKNMFTAADALAERIRALGQLAPSSIHDILQRSSIVDSNSDTSPGYMCEELASDHRRIAARLQLLGRYMENPHDRETARMVKSRLKFHEQADWMLSALSKT